jgi:hypothetical protein
LQPFVYAKADKFLLTITVVKDGKMGEYLAELRRSALINAKLKSPFSYNVMVKQQAGSSSTVITIRHLKEGMDNDFFNLPMNGFKNDYIA